ncbi:MAG: hypothetical protein H0X59_07660 [Chloroflexi bacterium]|nr:hypothetical protein [Chloroflexota bacterium]
MGTGGDKQYGLSEPHPYSEVANAETWGVMNLTLKPRGYAWRFIPIEGQTFTDSGSASCH